MNPSKYLAPAGWVPAIRAVRGRQYRTRRGLVITVLGRPAKACGRRPTDGGVAYRHDPEPGDSIRGRRYFGWLRPAELLEEVPA